MSADATRWQILLKADASVAAVAGLPPAVRAAYRAGTELKPDRLVIAGADEAFLRRWAPQLKAAGAPVLGDKAGPAALDPRRPILALDAESFPDAGALRAFAEAARGAAARRSLGGRAAAALTSRGEALGAGRRLPEEVHRLVLLEPGAEAAGDFLEARPEGAAASAALLYSRLGNPKDGYIARLDRVLSIALTRLMLPFPITPNQVTAASLLLGLLGAWWLAAPSASLQFAGAWMLWLCALLDGCDGEIARLKHLSSPSGAAFDLWADHAAHLATFIALPIGVARLHPGRDWLIPGALLVTGFLACGYSVWRLVLSVPEEERGPLAMTVERVASRDYVYLILALTAIGRLDLFVWAAALGSHAFNAWLWAAALRRDPRPTPGAAAPPRRDRAPS
jgi:1L-myo-inositol 1-phosphate cytidylyltransferase / CDP-L-myo-inositol myo-inositolphosphotransferase